MNPNALSIRTAPSGLDAESLPRRDASLRLGPCGIDNLVGVYKHEHDRVFRERFSGAGEWQISNERLYPAYWPVIEELLASEFMNREALPTSKVRHNGASVGS